MGMVTVLVPKFVSVILDMVVKIVKSVIRITGLLMINAWNVQPVRMAEFVMPLHSVNVQIIMVGTHV